MNKTFERETVLNYKHETELEKYEPEVQSTEPTFKRIWDGQFKEVGYT